MYRPEARAMQATLPNISGRRVQAKPIHYRQTHFPSPSAWACQSRTATSLCGPHEHGRSGALPGQGLGRNRVERLHRWAHALRQHPSRTRITRTGHRHPRCRRNSSGVRGFENHRRTKVSPGKINAFGIKARGLHRPPCLRCTASLDASFCAIDRLQQIGSAAIRRSAPASEIRSLAGVTSETALRAGPPLSCISRTACDRIGHLAAPGTASTWGTGPDSGRHLRLPILGVDHLHPPHRVSLGCASTSVARAATSSARPCCPAAMLRHAQRQPGGNEIGRSVRIDSRLVNVP